MLSGQVENSATLADERPFPVELVLLGSKKDTIDPKEHGVERQQANCLHLFGRHAVQQQQRRQDLQVFGRRVMRITWTIERSRNTATNPRNTKLEVSAREDMLSGIVALIWTTRMQHHAGHAPHRDQSLQRLETRSPLKFQRKLVLQSRGS